MVSEGMAALGAASISLAERPWTTGGETSDLLGPASATRLTDGFV